MIQYTGANLKQRALIALRENPLYIPEPNRQYRDGPIVKYPDAKAFQIYLTFTTIRYHLLGLLPIKDLPEIEAALKANEVLQAGWHPARLRHIERTREIKELLYNKSLEFNVRLKALKNRTWQAKEDLQAQLDEEFDARIAELEAASAADFAPWQPGLTANPDRAAYIASISERAQAIVGFTEAEENRLFVSSPGWRAEWSDFIFATSRTPDQRKLMRSLKLYSEARIIVNRKTIVELLQDVGDVNAHFTEGKLNLCISFSNEMAFKMCIPGNAVQMVKAPRPKGQHDAACVDQLSTAA